MCSQVRHNVLQNFLEEFLDFVYFSLGTGMKRKYCEYCEYAREMPYNDNVVIIEVQGTVTGIFFTIIVRSQFYNYCRIDFGTLWGFGK